MEKNAFNLEYFKFIRQEINDRIKIHHTVLGSKYLATGAAFSYLWTRDSDSQELRITALIVASLLSFLFDVLLLENLGWIKGAGRFVKDHVEKCSGTVIICPDRDGIIKWEQYFAQPSGQWTCFSPLGYLFGVWSIGFLLFCAGILTASASVADGRGVMVLFTLTLLGYCAVSYAYLPRRWKIGFVTLVALAVLFGINALTVTPYAANLMLLTTITVNGVFAGYTLRLIKGKLGDFRLRDAFLILLGLKAT